MRTMYILRGAPGSGKSTWVSKNNLEQYTLSADSIRLIFQSPVLKINGELGISQNNDKLVWELLLERLEDRMKRGEFVVVDATHYKSNLLNKYKSLIKQYRYKAYVIDFTNITRDELIRRNEARDKYKKVPLEVINKMCAVSENDKEVSSRYTILSPDEALKKLHSSLLYDFTDKYENVAIFGDIHGCHSPLCSYFKAHPYSEKTLYIFTGDYIDRGIQNKETLELLLSLSNNSNVLLLEGNHEGNLRLYSEDKNNKYLNKGEINALDSNELSEYIKQIKKSTGINSPRFITNTVPQIIDINKKDLREFCRKLCQMAYFTFYGKEYFVCHGGIPITPSLFISTKEIIEGVGRYEETTELNKYWEENTPDNCILIHGHRNVLLEDTKASDRVYNLCSEVEKGAPLRVLTLSKNECHSATYESTVFDKNSAEIKKVKNEICVDSKNEKIKELNSNKWINKKILNKNLISYNFSRNAFNRRKWNSVTCMARGLFINPNTEKVVCRGYEKFFSWGETERNKTENLIKSLKFPVFAYKKENGFLALVSYKEEDDNLLVCSKSVDSGAYVDMITEELNKLSKETLEYIKNFCKDNRVTFVFECINQDKDPHIIEYSQNKLVLLDIIQNSLQFEKFSYNRVKEISDKIKIECKKLLYTFDNFKELYNFKKEQDNSFDVKYEGWVLEDSENYMLKYKTRYYKFWKQMRSVKERVQKHQQLNKTYVNTDEVKILNLMQHLDYAGVLKDLSIIDVEKIYHKQTEELA